MRTQGLLISGLVFALLIAIFAAINVDPVQVNFLFAQTNLPLILVILGSALLGGASVGLFGIIRSFRLQKQLKAQQKELDGLRAQARLETAPVLADDPLPAGSIEAGPAARPSAE
nr:lipopolysaccharide assembly protein LapA domain-containing protein [Paenibacillus pasadenensis]